MAKDLRRKDTMLDCLKEADQTQKTLCTAQQQLARSTKALVKNHRTKFTTDTSWSTGPLMTLLKFCMR